MKSNFGLPIAEIVLVLHFYTFFIFASDGHFQGEVLYSPLISRKTASEPDSSSLFNPHFHVFHIILCLILISRIQLWPVVEENADIIQMFSAASVGVLFYPDSNRKHIYMYVFDINMTEYLNIFFHRL